MKILTKFCMCSSTILEFTFLIVFSKFDEAVSSSYPSQPPQSGTGYYRTENISVENWVDMASFNKVTSKIGKLERKLK